MSPRHVLCGVLGIVAAAGALSAQEPPQQPQPDQQPPPVTFRAEVNYVEVDARVLDASGRFVTGLAADDFQVLEDGKPQKVTVFSVVNLPVDRAERPLFASRPIEPDVATNRAGLGGRVYLVV
ncbi:MAG: hypothetical protein OEW19_03715, partial [Acidobacteriota bacterium]|nr:hypothetical protein [Acidobacteriota bacterium]